MRVVYVILHYMAIKDTIACVHNILDTQVSFEDIETQIVIVENGSPNDSFAQLTRKLKDTENVTILSNKKNIGFAKGNNLGFFYAKHTLQADFIVMLNNDTLITQKSFSEVFINKFNEYHYSVLGPDIITKNNLHQNPEKKQSWSFKELLVFGMKKRLQVLLSYIGYEKTGDKKSDYTTTAIKGDIKNTILHGACWIFSPLYIKKFNGIYDKTFLYMEEDILKLFSDFYGFLMMYTSDLQIMHTEDVATNMITISNAKRNRQKLRHLIRSASRYTNLKIYFLIKKALFSTLENIITRMKDGSPYVIDKNIPIGYLLVTSIQRLQMLLRGVFYTIGVASRKSPIFLGKKVRLVCKKRIEIGANVTLHNHVYIDALSNLGVTLQNGSSIGSNTIIRCSGNWKELGVGFVLGEYSSLADNCFVGATGGVSIGENVIGGQNIRFHSSNHIFSDINKPIKTQGVTAKGIIIGNNCWIGAGTIFCDGVSIGDGCVIGANSVVTKSFGKNLILAGTPAKIIGTRK